MNEELEMKEVERGDWVRYKSLKGDSYECVQIEDPILVHHIKCEGIPITPEILLKNDFTKVNSNNGVFYKLCGLPSNFNLVKITPLESNIFGAKWEIEAQTSFAGLGGYLVNDVHELQDSLRKFKIKKDIEL